MAAENKELSAITAMEAYLANRRAQWTETRDQHLGQFNAAIGALAAIAEAEAVIGQMKMQAHVQGLGDAAVAFSSLSAEEVAEMFGERPAGNGYYPPGDPRRSDAPIRGPLSAEDLAEREHGGTDQPST